MPVQFKRRTPLKIDKWKTDLLKAVVQPDTIAEIQTRAADIRAQLDPENPGDAAVLARLDVVIAERTAQLDDATAKNAAPPDTKPVQKKAQPKKKGK